MSDIQCYCETGGDGEFADVWVETYHVARKAHVCDECREGVKPGERYQRIFSLFDGGMTVYKLCAFCASEWDRLMAKPWREAPEMKLIGDLACHVLNEVRDAA